MKLEERQELLTAYALGTLSEPDAAVVRDLVRTDGAAARELAGYHDIVDLIALSVPLRRADPALRARVLEAARRERASGVRRFSVRRLLPWTAAAAIIALVVSWGVSLQQDMDSLRRENASLTAVVEADAKRIETLMEMDGNLGSELLRLQFESTTSELQLALAVSTALDVRSSTLQPTSAGHGAAGHFLWSSETGAGWLTARDLPQLPLGDVYQVWLSDAVTSLSVGTLVAGADGRFETVVVPGTPIRPLRIVIAVARDGGSETIGSPIVLEGPIAP